jgi:hypothetical protein
VVEEDVDARDLREHDEIGQTFHANTARNSR